MAPGLTVLQSAAIQVLVDRSLKAAVRELNDMAMPRLQGLAAALHKLQTSVEERAGTLLTRVGDTDARADNAFKKANTQLDGIEGHLKDVDSLIEALEGSNGPPV